MTKMEVFAVVLVVLTLLSVALTSCTKKPDFEKVDVITTTKKQKVTETYTQSNFEVVGVRMGMSVEETQRAIGQLEDLKYNDKGVLYFAVNMSDLQFVTKGLQSGVYFIYDKNVRLCEIQYLSKKETGFKLEEAISKFDGDYGKHAKVLSGVDKTNYVWMKDDAYIVITSVTTGTSAVSYFAKDYFEENYKEEVSAYKILK